MSVRFQWTGVAEQQAELASLPADLTAEAAGIVETGGQLAGMDLRTGYAQGPTGNLRRGVVVRLRNPGQASVTSTVLSRAPHAWLYEKGSKVRHNKKGNGRGRMPRRPIFGAIMVKSRIWLRRHLADLLTRHGLRVSGS